MRSDVDVLNEETRPDPAWTLLKLIEPGPSSAMLGRKGMSLRFDTVALIFDPVTSKNMEGMLPAGLPSKVSEGDAARTVKRKGELV